MLEIFPSCSSAFWSCCFLYDFQSSCFHIYTVSECLKKKNESDKLYPCSLRTSLLALQISVCLGSSEGHSFIILKWCNIFKQKKSIICTFLHYTKLKFLSFLKVSFFCFQPIFRNSLFEIPFDNCSQIQKGIVTCVHIVDQKDAHHEICEWGFIWGKMRTAAWEDSTSGSSERLLQRVIYERSI